MTQPIEQTKEERILESKALQELRGNKLTYQEHKQALMRMAKQRMEAKTQTKG